MKRLVMTWINNLKIAIIEENTQAIGSIIKDLPEFKTLEEAKQALALIGKAIEIVDDHKKKTSETMNKIRKAKAFLKNQ